MTKGHRQRKRLYISIAIVAVFGLFHFVVSPSPKSFNRNAVAKRPWPAPQQSHEQVAPIGAHNATNIDSVEEKPIDVKNHVSRKQKKRSATHNDTTGAHRKHSFATHTTDGVATAKPHATIVSEENQPSIRTYDDIIARDLPAKHYFYNSSDRPNNLNTNLPCDIVSVPFSVSQDALCTRFLVQVMEAASLHSMLPVTVPYFDLKLKKQRVTVSFEPMRQKFEQRTIKFKIGYSFYNEANVAVASFAAILKVPQVLFPIEPFAERAAFDIDRLLRVHRVPPTVLVALPIEWVRNQSLHRTQRAMEMVPEFLEASNVKSYDEWIDKDFVSFVSRKASDGTSRFTKNETHVWCSLQLFMTEVQPILYSPLRVPYSKSNPGWHRWFDPDFNEYPVAAGPLLALSELAVFDSIIMNNDRSPNKNNFIVGGCKNCNPSERRPSGLAPTIVHLDHGMSFYGAGVPISHNPLGKVANKVRFCIFYRPQIVILRHLNLVNGNSEQTWRAQMKEHVHPIALRAIGESKIGDCGSQVLKVLKRLEYCLGKYNETVVLRP